MANKIQKTFDEIVFKMAEVVKLINEDIEDPSLEMDKVDNLNDEISDLTIEIMDEENNFLSFNDLDDYCKDLLGKDYFGDRRCWSYLHDALYDVYYRMNNVIDDIEESMQTGLGMQTQLPTNSTYDDGIFDVYSDDEEEKKDMKRLEEKRIDEEDRVEALAQFLGLDEEEKEEIEVDDETLTYDGDEFLVLTDDEADEWFDDYQRSTWDDMGIQSFSESFQDWIINNAVDKSWFEDAKSESDRFYAEDIASERSREFDNRLVEECYERGLIDDDDFEEDEDGDVDHEQCKKDNDDLIELMVEDMANDYSDPVEWYKDTFGEKELSKTVIENNLVDLDEVIEEVKSLDGRGATLSSYDGEENSEKVNGEWFYIYRQ